MSVSRRRFFQAVELSAVASLAAQEHTAAQQPRDRTASAPLRPGKGITNNVATPHMKLRSVDATAVRWTSGVWAERFDTCSHATIQRLWEEMEKLHFANFRRAAGELPGTEFVGAGFSDGDLYKWLEATVAAYNVTRDPELEALIDRVISVIAKTPQSNGYIFTKLTLERRSGRKDARPFEKANDFETYNCGHLMTTACLHYRVTGKRTLLDLAIGASDFLCDAFAHPTPELARFDICPSHYMGIIEMYRTTGDPKYLALGKKFIDMRDLVNGGTDQNQERISFRRQTKAVGHAVRANYLYAGAADVYSESGDPSLFQTLDAIWQDVASHKVYITGATGALNTGTSPSTYGNGLVQELVAKGDYTYARQTKESLASRVDFVSQSYGREYQLPNLTSYNESCATVGSALWNWRMLQITADAKYAHQLENTLLNGILSAVSLDGRRFFYANALKRSKATPFPMRYPPERQSQFRAFCCPPNVARTIAETSNYAYCVTSDAVWTVLYGANTWNGSLPNRTELALTQKTDYPWSGDITIAVEPKQPAEFSLMLRIPPWAHGASVRVKSAAGAPLAESDLTRGQYFEVKRTWTTGDVLELSLPMKVQLVEAHPLVEETRGQVAVARGPLVYCLESADIADETGLDDLRISRKPQFETVEQTIAGARVVALEGEMVKHEPRDWNGDLYREISQAEPSRVKVRLIPYFCWDNRGNTDMSIWLPLA